MKILEQNLKQFIKIPKDIYNITNSYITEVEDFKHLFDFENVIIGKVLEVNKHENADTLFVTKVDTGEDVRQIVCGAANVVDAKYVIVAKDGAVLPGDFKIKNSKIRGVESHGMICSLSELGIKEEYIPENQKDGIFKFDNEMEVGSNPFSSLNINGFLIELDLTPNRNDLLSHLGYARDIASVINEEVNIPNFEIKEENKENPLSVKIESKNTNSYYARYFDNVVIKDSPLWLKLFLEQMGVNPVNNIVDITNYILFTYGIPMHAFDYNKFGSNEIVIKDNTKEQTVKTLDEQEIKITNDEILITNGKEIMALGGIMGLDNSKITNETTKVILEVASFSKEQTRKSSNKLGLKSDSSLRFERGIDENVMMDALNHATYLIKELANAKVYKGISGQKIKTFENRVIKVDLERIKKDSGHDFSNSDIIDILKRLNYELKQEEENIINVKAPSYRHDINIYADVLEEVIRIYGMDNIEVKPMLETSSKGLTEYQKNIRKIRHYLSNIGLNEVLTYSLLNKSDVKSFNDFGEIESVLKPMTIDRMSLRQSLLNGLIETKKYNNKRSIFNVNIFEIGNVFAKDKEDKFLSVLLSKRLNNNLWKKENANIDFFYLKGILNNIFNILNISYTLEESNNNQFHPYQQAHIIVDNNIVGIIGKVHPLVIKNDTYVFELNLDSLNKVNKFTYKPISKYPNIERDLAFIIDENVKVDKIINLIKQTAKNDLVNIELFDIYTGQSIGENRKSLAFNLVFNNNNKTLLNEDVDKIIKKIVNRMKFELEAEIR